jgi:hypothetical protein
MVVLVLSEFIPSQLGGREGVYQLELLTTDVVTSPSNP